MPGARTKKAPDTLAGVTDAAETLGRAIDAANVARERLVRGLKRRSPYAKRLKLAAILGKALRGVSAEGTR